jgi:hypothetical protein
VLPGYSVQTLGGVRVGYIGVVTAQTGSLVSPDGIAGVQFRDPVAEANKLATELSDGDEANGEADVLVLLAHEGAPRSTSARRRTWRPTRSSGTSPRSARRSTPSSAATPTSRTPSRSRSPAPPRRAR